MNFITTKIGRIVLEEIPTFFVKKISLSKDRKNSFNDLLEQEAIEELSLKNKIKIGEKIEISYISQNKIVKKIELVSKCFQIDALTERIIYEDDTSSLYNTFGIFNNQTRNKEQNKKKLALVKKVHNNKNMI